MLIVLFLSNDFVVFSVFSSLAFANLIAFNSSFEIFEYAFFISVGDIFNDERFAPVNFFSYFFES